MPKKKPQIEPASHAAALYMKPKMNWLLVAIREDLETVDVGTAADGYSARSSVTRMMGPNPENAKGLGPHDWEKSKQLLKRLWETALRDDEFKQFIIDGFTENTKPKI